ncbi:MAG: hypothetical protein GY749_09800 [Desulfobacteraceae bacterium]|nr:hypothetical protein [Desulfobacteraceae bacterium]
MKQIRVAVFIFITGLIFPNMVLAKRSNVIIAGLNWSGAIAVANVMKYVLDKKLGIPAEIKPLTLPVAWSAMDMGTADILPDIWIPNQKKPVKEYVETQKSVTLVKSYINASQGIYMLSEVAKANSIKSVFDLRGKEKMFDMNGNGIGEMWIGPYNWETSDINKSKIREYGINLETVEFEQWIFLAVLKEALRKKKPLVFYYWEPDWPVAAYDLLRLEEPAFDPKKWVMADKNNKKNRIRCAYPPATVYVGVSRQLKKRLPRAYKFFMNWHIPIDEVSWLVAEIEQVPGNPRKDPEWVARTWVKKHPKILQDWLKNIERPGKK